MARREFALLKKAGMDSLNPFRLFFEREGVGEGKEDARREGWGKGFDKVESL